MENEIYLMSPIWDDTAETYCKTLDCIPKDEDVTTLMNCPGGSVFAGWTMIGRLKERTGKNNCKVYGHAASMAMYFLLYCDYSEALDVTRFLIHRASGPSYTEDDKKFLKGINEELRRCMENKLNMEIFNKITGLTMDDVFEGDEVKDVWLTSKQAKKIGLINKINRMSPEEITNFNKKFVALKPTRGSGGETRGSEIDDENKNNYSSKINKKMTLEEFKSQNPALYAQVFDDGIKAGKTAEQIRTKSWLAYLEIDKENVITSIKEGKDFTHDVMAEMSVKMSQQATKAAIENDSQKDLQTQRKDDKTQHEVELTAFEESVKQGVNVKTII